MKSIIGTTGSSIHENGKMPNGTAPIGITIQANSNTKNFHKKSFDKDSERDQQDKKMWHNHTNGSIHSEVEYIERIK